MKLKTDAKFAEEFRAKKINMVGENGIKKDETKHTPKT